MSSDKKPNQPPLPQLTLFETEPTDARSPAPEPSLAQSPAPAPQAPKVDTGSAAAETARIKPNRAKSATAAKPTAAKVKRSSPAPQPALRASKTANSSAIPAGDVRLTANIRQDLHLKLKIAAAHQRTTIGELIEQLVEDYL